MIAGLVVVAGVGIGAATFLRAKPAPEAPAEERPVVAPPAAAASAPAVPAAVPPPASPAPPGSTCRGPTNRLPPTAAAPPAGSEAAAPLNESVLMARLRSVAGSNFPLAAELARAGNRRFPDSPDAPERASILIHALAAQEMAKEARGEAEYAVNHYPDSSMGSGD